MSFLVGALLVGASLVGAQITSCWRGQRTNGYTVEFRRVRDTWNEFGNGNYKKTFDHIQTIPSGSEAEVLQQSGLKPLVIDKDHVYYDGRSFANGRWHSGRTEWIGTRGDGATAQFTRHGSTWKEYKAGRYLKEFRYILSVPTSRTAHIMQQRGLWALIVDDYSVSYQGVVFATGTWGCD